MAKSKQHELEFRIHGGRRCGAGRKPKGERPGVSHAPRPALASRFPGLVTIKVQPHVWKLRGKAAFNRIWHALRKVTGRRGFRVVHFSVQNDHVHMLVEARDATTLSRGMQGLSVRIARALNRLMKRTGSVFADRYHERILRSPKEVRHALQYTLNNAKKHGIGDRASGWVDARSSAPFFDGWSREVRFDSRTLPGADPPTETASTWLLRVGWRERCGGPLDPDRVPGGRRSG